MHPEVIVGPAFFLMVAFVVWTAVTAWQRRQRLRLLMEFNNRLIDRLDSVKDFIELAKVDGGLQFLNAVAADAPVTGPRDRILRATEMGIVLVAFGIGLLFLGWYLGLEGRDAFTAVGVIALSLGIGFLCSSVVSFRITSSLVDPSPAAPGLPRDSQR